MRERVHTQGGNCPPPASQPHQASTLASATNGIYVSGITPTTIVNTIINKALEIPPSECSQW